LSSDLSAVELQDDDENIAYEIFGGWNDAKGANPWFAKIEVYKIDPSSDPEVCGGTLIRDNVVVTGRSYKITKNCQITVIL
jgi:hypothetical protein